MKNIQTFIFRLITHYSLLTTKIILCIIFTSCSQIEQLFKEYESEDIIASIGDKHLYQKDIEHLIPINTNKEDSAFIIDTYIHRWATNILILESAERNISNQAEINKMVEEYRQTLTIHYYKQEMVKNNVDIPSDEETFKYYETNQSLFTVKEPMVKGAIIKIPNNIKTDKITKLFKNLNENLEEIEKYVLQYANHYELFTDNWIPLNNILKSNLQINKIGFYENKDSLNITLINITDYIKQGELAPYEIAKEDARNSLYNQYKMEYLKNFEQNIYNHALQHNKIILNPQK